MKTDRSNKFNRRQFLGDLTALTTAVTLFPSRVFTNNQKLSITKPPRLRPGDTVGLITPASPAFEPATIREGIETLQSLGFNVKTGNHIKEKWGYLAGQDEDRAADLHQMF